MSLVPNNIKFCLALVFLVFFFGGTALGYQIVKDGPVDITLEPILASQWACHIQDRDLYVRTIDGETTLVRDPQEGATILSPALIARGNTLFVAWIEKGLKGNRLYTASINKEDNSTSAPLEVASSTNATTARIFTYGEETVFILEALTGRSSEVFINVSGDRGKSFKRMRLNTGEVESLYSLAPVLTDDTVWIFFFGIKGEKKNIWVKGYKIPTMEVKESALIAEISGISFITAVKVNDRPVAIYKTTEGEKFVLNVALKETEGWKTFSIKGAGGLDVARLDHHAWDERLLIAFSGEKRGVFKQRIYTAVSENGGKRWSLRRIDTRQFDNTTSWLPRMAVEGEKVAVVWEDSRDIRRRIRMKLSPDRGKTWLRRDIPVSDRKTYAIRPRISSHNGNIYLAWHQYRSDEKRTADTALMKLTWDEAFRMAREEEKIISPKEKKRLLFESVSRYWDAMINKDHKTTYELHDPFFRARIPLDYYSSRRGPMIYHQYEILDAEIKGNEALVKARVRYEIPSFRIMGRETSVSPKDFPIEDTWLFIDGKWYRKFVDAMSGGSAIKY